jgi:protein associated with RNAse G/E
MRLIHQQKSSMQLEAGAQRYIDYLSQMDVEAIQEAKTADLNEFKEDNIEWLERGILDHVHDELNKFLAKKGQFIQPRVLLSIEHKHEDEAEDDGDSESDSKPRVKREQS